MGLNPKDYAVSDDLIRQRLCLSKQVTIVPFGYEGIIDKAVLSILKTRFDSGSLFIRTRPDFFVIDENELYFVEAKQKTKNIEAIQLLYNKQHERMGIKVLYSFPELTIRATLIPMDVVVVPENYKKEFDKNLKHLFENEGINKFRYVHHVKDGSGDAFVPVELDDLSILAEELTQ